MIAHLQLEDAAASYYLQAYLQALEATTYIIEEHYIDRHYLDDYARYYSRCFQPPCSACRRVHFFARLDPCECEQRFREAYTSKSARARAEQYLQERYLGFIVLRPLPRARIGRTVLKTYPADGGRRHYEVLRPYPVHVAGLRLSIDGLAYQQQDRGAAVCASTALWVALQKVAHMVGNRSPTPSEVTEAAGSPYPASSGLEELQMARALSKLGYIADRFGPSGNHPLFRSLLITALDSQLPVVLLLENDRGEGHAVTVTGYSDPGGGEEVPAGDAQTPPLPMKGAAVRVLYVHDDNLGFHAHYELAEDEGTLTLLRGRESASGSSWRPDKWKISAALVPKPPKLRLPLEDLRSYLYDVRRLFTEQVFPKLPIEYSARFSSGVGVRRELVADSTFDSGQVADFNFDLSLPRHVGVLHVHSSDRSLCDVLLDVTEVSPRILAILARGVPANTRAGNSLRQAGLAQEWRVLLANPATPETR